MKPRTLSVSLATWVGGTVLLVACSNSGSAGVTLPVGTSSDGGTSSTSPSVITGLQQLVAEGQTYASVPNDPATTNIAAQVVKLQYDRAAALATAGLIQVTESDPNYPGNKTLLEVSRQASLTQAASDLTQIQVLVQTNVPGRSTLAADGGAANVINAIVVEAFAARADAILKAKNPPTADQIADFLQEVQVVLGDQGNEGHDVAAQLVVQALLSDAGLVQTDAGLP